MKKNFTLNCKMTAMILLMMLVPASGVFAQVTIAQWNGYTPSAPPAEGKFLAKDGIIANKGTAVLTRDAAGTGYAVNTDGVAASTGFEASDVTEKYWIVEFSTTGYENLTVTSKQRGSNTGPANFTIQYKIGVDGTWADVADGVVVVSSNNYTTGTKTDLLLPAQMADQATVALRWLCSSTTSIGSGTVAPAGNNRLDVTVNGTAKSGVTDPEITVSAANLFFAKQNASAIVTVSGKDLTEGILITSDNPDFTTDPQSLPQDAQDAQVTVQFIGTDTLSSGVITLQSGLATETIIVNGFNSRSGSDGTKEKPFSIKEAISVNGKTGTESYWVQGYIVGNVNTSTGAITNPTTYVASNLALASDTERTSHVSVQLVTGDARTALNLFDHPENLDKEVKIYGTLELYCSIAGVKGISDYVILSGTDINENPVASAYSYASGQAIQIFNIPEGATLYLFDSLGKLIDKRSDANINESIPVNQKGIFFVKIVSADGTGTLKVLNK